MRGLPFVLEHDMVTVLGGELVGTAPLVGSKLGGLPREHVTSPSVGAAGGYFTNGRHSILFLILDPTNMLVPFWGGRRTDDPLKAPTPRLTGRTARHVGSARKRTSAESHRTCSKGQHLLYLSYLTDKLSSYDSSSPVVAMPGPSNVPALLTIPEVAEILRIGEKTVRRMIARRDLRAFRVGGQLRIHRDSVVSLLKTGELR